MSLLGHFILSCQGQTMNCQLLVLSYLVIFEHVSMSTRSNASVFVSMTYMSTTVLLIGATYESVLSSEKCEVSARLYRIVTGF